MYERYTFAHHIVIGCRGVARDTRERRGRCGTSCAFGLCAGFRKQSPYVGVVISIKQML